ncbi:MAG: lamin tail domain-containing protein, partial [Bacteroides sp.]|nr:lamin tail domain-containing protein [Bacteroides sp.]
MLKYYLTLYLLFYLILTYAQTSIAKYSFEASGDTWTTPIFSTPPCTLADDTWNIHSQLGSIAPSDGDFFWGIQDLNGNCGSSGFEQIEFQDVDIAQFRNVVLSFDVQVLGYDNNDDMKYQLWLDDQEQPEVLFIDGGNNLNTEGWSKIILNIPNSTSRLRFILMIRQNGSDIAGIDNIQVMGEPLIACDEILISEYVEGSSSTTIRNNYIELYNASQSLIDLSSYALIKYTGKNTNISATLNLSGNIPALGTFLIEDDQESLNIDADLSTNSAVMNYNGDDKIALTKDGEILDMIGTIGDSVAFAKDITLRRQSHIQSPDNQFNLSEWDVYDLEDVTGLGQHSSYCEGRIPEIALESKGYSIKDGSNKTSFVNDTYFGALPIEKDSVLIRSYIIFNLGNKDLQIFDILISGKDAIDFNANFQGPGIVVPGDSLAFSITYKPSTLGLSTAEVEIINDDASENPYNFTIQGEGTGPVGYPLIISQYYEGEGNNKWIEVTNIGQELTTENMYYLALFWNADTQNPIGIKPSRKKPIPALSPGQTIKYSATLNVNGPAYAIDGQEVKTTVCSFTGDDILIISTSDDETCWENKTDIIGKIGNWGTDISMVRKYGCLQDGPNTGFDLSGWLSFHYTEIDNALIGTNLRLGEYYSGPTSFENGTWQHGLPDLQREAVILHDYDTGMDGPIEACNLHISDGANLTIAAGTEVVIQNNLLVSGNLEIRDKGSLRVINDDGLTDNHGDISIHKSTTLLKPYDYTYWSSPVQDAELETVFEASPKNSFYIFSTENYEDLDEDGLDDNNDAWVRVLGAMDIARGYTSMAPNAPFTDLQHVVFKGKPNNGRITIPLELQKNGNNLLTDWNLIGNPYPSAIDAELLFSDPENQSLLNGTLYFWTHSTPLLNNTEDGDQSYSSDDYAMYTIGTGGIKANPNGLIPTQYIASCQGFFVEAISQGNLVFNNSMRSSLNNDNFFKTIKRKHEPEPSRLWLNLYNNQGAFSQILLGFIQGAGKEFDKNYDGIRLRGNKYLSFYAP